MLWPQTHISPDRVPENAQSVPAAEGSAVGQGPEIGTGNASTAAEIEAEAEGTAESGVTEIVTGAATSMQMQALQAIQQQQLQKQLLTQQLLMQQQAMGGAGLLSNKKQREVYVGNLTIGVVNDLMLRELFNGALSHLVPDPVANPPVVSAQLDPSGRFGFVEVRTEELASAAMQLDKVELCGRHINVGRPKGYIEPPAGAAPTPAINMAQMFAAQMRQQAVAPPPAASAVLLLENMMLVSALRDPQERQDVREDVEEEASKYGAVVGVAVPPPPLSLADNQPGRVYVKFAAPGEAQKAKDVFQGRQFDGNVIKAALSSDEDFQKAQQGEWIMAPGSSPLPLPPPPALGMMPVGAAAVPPGAVGGLGLAFNPDQVPVQEGWVKMRGIPFTATKRDIAEFFENCGAMSDEKVKLVVGADGRPTGEAYVEISGPNAKLPLALAKDRQMMPNSSRYVEIFTSNKDEVDRRALTGVLIV
ncbi:hypothetical protein WJX72_007388 [[Myrmecia] bisecta]|uniref:RRM domain-containing protein n=1 Tax=[Myrmecia] bisecta TaxID=41462 RepID=A0AAW1QRI1_9CHLO